MTFQSMLKVALVFLSIDGRSRESKVVMISTHFDVTLQLIIF
jgi:hypothetical protein